MADVPPPPGDGAAPTAASESVKKKRPSRMADTASGIKSVMGALSTVNAFMSSKAKPSLARASPSLKGWHEYEYTPVLGVAAPTPPPNTPPVPDAAFPPPAPAPDATVPVPGARHRPSAKIPPPAPPAILPKRPPQCVSWPSKVVATNLDVGGTIMELVYDPPAAQVSIFLL